MVETTHTLTHGSIHVSHIACHITWHVASHVSSHICSHITPTKTTTIVTSHTVVQTLPWTHHHLSLILLQTIHHLHFSFEHSGITCTLYKTFDFVLQIFQ